LIYTLCFASTTPCKKERQSRRSNGPGLTHLALVMAPLAQGPPHIATKLRGRFFLVPHLHDVIVSLLPRPTMPLRQAGNFLSYFLLVLSSCVCDDSTVSRAMLIFSAKDMVFQLIPRTIASQSFPVRVLRPAIMTECDSNDYIYTCKPSLTDQAAL
jgi:hypothetical protein